MKLKLMNKLNEYINGYCSLDSDYKVAFVVRIGYKYEGVIQEENTLYILNKTEDAKCMYCLDDDSEYGDPDGSILNILNESFDYYYMDYYDNYLELDIELTNKYRGYNWHQAKKELYLRNDYPWFDKDTFLANYNDQNYITENTKPLIHTWTSCLEL